MITTSRAQAEWLASMCTEAAVLAVAAALADTDDADIPASLRERIQSDVARAIGDVVEKMAAPAIALQRIEHLESGTVIGYEALARFGGGTGAIVNFAEAADRGVAVDLELVALRSALARLDELPADAFLGVNVSAAALVDDRALETLQAVDTARLVVELTGQSEILDIQTLHRRMRDLRAIGAVIAVDGAGVGFFRGERVLELRPEIIKVDRSLVAGCDSDPDRRQQLTKLIAIGRRIGALVIGIGVERAEERDVLGSLGFDAVQGHFVGEPSVDLDSDERTALVAP